MHSVTASSTIESGAVNALPTANDSERPRETLSSSPDSNGQREHRSACVDLSRSFYQQYQTQGSTDLLDKAIALGRRGYAACPPGHSDRARACAILASSLWSQFQNAGDFGELDQAIELEREALTLRPTGHRDRAESCASLSKALSSRHLFKGGMDLLNESITLSRESFALRPDKTCGRATSCTCLATANLYLFRQTSNVALLDDAITLEREALDILGFKNQDSAISCASLAHACWLRHQTTGETDLLDESIALGRQAIPLFPPSGYDRAMASSRLSTALWTQHERTGDISLLNEAVQIGRAAITLMPKRSPHRAMVCGNLANILSTFYHLTGDIAPLNQAIDLAREALALRPTGHPSRVLSCFNLMDSLYELFKQTNNATLLDESISLGRESLASQSEQYAYYAVCCSNLAISISTRYRQTGDMALLDEAITLQRKALALQPRGKPAHSACCQELASSLSSRFQQVGDSALLLEAIALGRRALESLPDGHYHRSERSRELADSLLLRYKQTSEDILLLEAIALGRTSLALLPDGHHSRADHARRLAGSLLLQYQHTFNDALLDEALELANQSVSSSQPSAVWRSLALLCRLQLQPSTPHFSIPAALQYMLRSSHADADDIREFASSMDDNIRLLWSVHSIWTADVPSSLVHIYSNLIDCLPHMASVALTASSQLEALKCMSAIGSHACVAALLAGYPTQAVELLDHAHGIVWAQALRQRDPQLEDLPQDLASELEDLLRATAMMVLLDDGPGGSEPEPPKATGRYLTSRDIRHEQNSRIQVILSKVRNTPGLERFMLGKTFEQLDQAAHHHPVVMLVAAQGYAYALIISKTGQDSPQGLPLPITSGRLCKLKDISGQVDQHRGGLSAQDVEVDMPRAMRKSLPEKASMQTVLADLWHYVAKPVMDYLHFRPTAGRARPRLHWCPTGDFALLPIHAAGVYNGPDHQTTCCSDYVVSSYTPTLSALLRAQSKPPRVAPATLSILAVAEDSSTSATMQRLWTVEEELRHVEDTAKASAFDCTVRVIASGATVEGVTDQIQSAHFVHLACHGTQHQVDALESGFHLSDGTLTVSKLMSLDLDQAWFAYLSACETAKGDPRQPDQTVHLAAAMLFAGFKSVVATIWSMSDIDGPDMAKWFYENLLANETIDVDAVAYALDAAVRQLREKIPGAPKRWAPYIHVGA